MTAWSILTLNSALPSGTAWQHLNNQVGGGGGGTVIVGGKLSANISMALIANISHALSANLKSINLAVDNPIALSANINKKLEASICL